MRASYLLLASSLFFSSCSIGFNSLRVDGNGDEVIESRELVDFYEVACSGSMDLTVVQGEEFKVTVYGDSNLMDYVETSVRGNRLILSTKDGYSPSPMPSIEVQMPLCTRVERVGSGATALFGLDGGRLSLSLTGSGDLTAEGEMSEVDLSMTGSGNVDLLALRAASMTVNKFGSGEASVSVVEQLHCDGAGSGDVVLAGDPKLSFDFAGSGSLVRISPSIRS